jgi:hypothetical protein
MRKISLILLSLGALLALPFIWQSPATADASLGSPAPPDGFGKKAAGLSLYRGNVEWVGDPNTSVFEAWGMQSDDPALQVAGLVHMHADGTLLATRSSDNFARSGPLYGTWERIGPRTVRVKQLIFNFADPDSVDPSHPITMLTGIVRNTTEFTFNEEFTSYEGTWVMEEFLPEQMTGADLLGPLTPNTDAVPLGGPLGDGNILGGWFGGEVVEVTPYQGG